MEQMAEQVAVRGGAEGVPDGVLPAARLLLAVLAAARRVFAKRPMGLVLISSFGCRAVMRAGERA